MSGTLLPIAGIVIGAIHGTVRARRKLGKPKEQVSTPIRNSESEPTAAEKKAAERWNM
jgi:hypothetical protein